MLQKFALGEHLYLLSTNARAFVLTKYKVLSTRVQMLAQWLKFKIRSGERYIYVWTPGNDRVLFPSIITI